MKVVNVVLKVRIEQLELYYLGMHEEVERVVGTPGHDAHGRMSKASGQNDSRTIP